MVKTKIIAIMASAALVAVLGLSACGSQGQSSSSASSSSATSGAAAAPSSAAVSEIESSVLAELTVVSWQGALADGTLVDYISSEDGTNGGFVLTKDDTTEPKKWLGAMTTTEDGTVTITDDATKESVSFKLVGITEDGAVAIEVEGYGKGALMPLTAADWQRIAEVEELSKVLGTTVNTIGLLDDGSLMVYIENTEGTKAVVGLVQQGSDEMKVWAGEATTAEDGKETVTDETTGETFSYTWTENAEDGTVNIDADGFGKGILVKMTVADWLILNELAEQMSQL